MSDAFEIAREGFLDAQSDEPLFPDADPNYATGWCIYHDCENPFSQSSLKGDTENG